MRKYFDKCLAREQNRISRSRSKLLLAKTSVNIAWHSTNAMLG